MSKFNLIVLSLIIFIMNMSKVFSQNEIKPMKQLQPKYEKIIHFDKNDYHLREIPDGYEGPVQGVKGLYAGDKYLIVWDNRNVFVFDLKTYAKLATLSPPLSINDIVETNGVIYCLYSGGRTDPRIYVYDFFDSFKEYIFINQFCNLAEYKAFRQQFAVDQNETQKREMKRGLPRSPEQHSIRGKHIRTLDVTEEKIYANIEHNFLNLDQDFSIENDNGKLYLFTKQEIQKKERKLLPFLFDGMMLSYDRKKLDDNSVKIEFFFNDMKDNFLKKEEIVLESNEQIGRIVSSIPITLIDNRIILRCARDYLNKNYSGDFILIVNFKTKLMQNIELPVDSKNLGIVTNYLKYSSFSNSSIFLISYNPDLSFDILKVEVE